MSFERQPWQPLSLNVNDHGHLALGAVDLWELAQQHKTPLYVMDLETLREKALSYKRCYAAYPGAIQPIYASKALSTVGILQLMHAWGFAIDVVSGGELFTAFKAKIPGEKIIFHGNNKSSKELSEAILFGVGRIVVDSLDEIERLGKLCNELTMPANVLLRVVPGIEAHTHDYIKTGQRDTKFGVPAEFVTEAVKRIVAHPRLNWQGLHAHVGSQIFDAEPLAQCAEVLLELANRLHQETGVWIKDLNIGGGLGIHYTAADDPQPLERLAEAAIIRIQNICSKLSKPLPRLLFEPGRSLVATAGITLYEVGTLKDIPGLRKIAAVDGGMADNPRPITYGAAYTADCVNKATFAERETYTIAGKFCESGDILIKQTELPPLALGDILAVYGTGAYNYSMASNYNRVPRPTMLLVDAASSQVHTLLKRETYEDLCRLDKHLDDSLLVNP